jgi:hypothetical protein
VLPLAKQIAEALDVAPDGRFVFLKPPAPIQSRPLTVVINWVDDLERRTR